MPDIKNPKVFADLMRKAFNDYDDVEANHSNADDLMCSLLEELGYTEAVQIFKNGYKWYA
jgi:hypothetical protein